MNKSKLLVLTLAIVLVLLGGHVFAQSYPDPAAQGSVPQSSASSASPEVQAKLDKISAELNLTDDQKAKIKPILQSEVQQLQAIGDDTSMTPDQKKAKAKEIHMSARSEINTILTPDQQKKWASMKESAKEER